MDKSETNIKMCERAEEIQRLRSLDCAFNDSPTLSPSELMKYAEAGDCFYHYYFKKVKYFNDEDAHIQVIGGKITWLPHQDQLQEMLYYPLLSLLIEFVKFVVEDIIPIKEGVRTWVFRQYCGQFTSMGQLWLAFVMKEKYHKIWDGENWIKEAKDD